MSLRDLTRRDDNVGLILLLAVAAVVALSLAAGEVQNRAPRPPWMVQEATYVRARVEVAQTRLLHRAVYDSPGGIITVRWYDSDFEPLGPGVFGIGSIYIDGQLVASAVKGSQIGDFEDGPAELTWLGRLRRGPHVIEIRVRVPNSTWGVPYSDPGEIGVDRLTVMAGQDAG